MRRTLACAIFASGLITGPAFADDVSDDARCLMVTLIGIGQASEPDKKAQLASAAMFFMGRLDREAKDVDLVDKIRREGRGITSPQELGSEARRCADIVRRRGDALQDIGQQLSAKSK
jgi:hypothetical protein